MLESGDWRVGGGLGWDDALCERDAAAACLSLFSPLAMPCRDRDVQWFSSRHVAALVSESRGFGYKPWLAGVYQTSDALVNNRCETRRGFRSRWPRFGILAAIWGGLRRKKAKGQGDKPGASSSNTF